MISTSFSVSASTDDAGADVATCARTARTEPRTQAPAIAAPATSSTREVRMVLSLSGVGESRHVRLLCGTHGGPEQRDLAPQRAQLGDEHVHVLAAAVVERDRGVAELGCAPRLALVELGREPRERVVDVAARELRRGRRTQRGLS